MAAASVSLRALSSVAFRGSSSVAVTSNDDVRSRRPSRRRPEAVAVDSQAVSAVTGPLPSAAVMTVLKIEQPSVLVGAAVPVTVVVASSV